MLITRKSQISGIVRSKEINITPEQLKAWENGALIQRVVPQLSESDREFIISGSTDEEWEETFKREDN
jgi:hypothetical protein